MRVAVVHEWLSDFGGSEAVFAEMARLLPTADLYALSCSRHRLADDDPRSISVTALGRPPSSRLPRPLLLPGMPMAWRLLDRPSYDLVITSSHAFSRYFAKPGDGQHYSYTHAPLRYAWDSEIDKRFLNRGPHGRLAAHVLRTADRRSSRGVSSFAANSDTVKQRILSYYGRRSTTIYPPVDTQYFDAINLAKRDYLVAASRWIPYKRIDLAVAAAAHVKMPLVVAGSGPEEKRLRQLATRIHPGKVQFVVSPSGSELRDIIAGARALVFPAEEDFGIVPVEAMAAGTPVVGFARGGVSETVLDGTTGVLADVQSPEAFGAALEQCLSLELESDKCRERARLFSRQRFGERLFDWLPGEVRNLAAEPSFVAGP